MSKICECGAEMKRIPPGVSKKNGKPYGEFYSCPQCKATAPGTPLPKTTETQDPGEPWKDNVSIPEGSWLDVRLGKIEVIIAKMYGLMMGGEKKEEEEKEE